MRSKGQLCKAQARRQTRKAGKAATTLTSLGDWRVASINILHESASWLALLVSGNLTAAQMMKMIISQPIYESTSRKCGTSISAGGSVGL